MSGQTVAKWSKLELDLETTLAAANPFDPQQIDLHVRFTSPQGEPIDVPAFFYAHDGASGWKARFTPPVEGEWTAQAFARKPQEAMGGVTQFRVEPPQPGSHGFVRVDPRNQHYLAFDDGAPFFAIGLNLGWWRDDPLKDYERWLDAMQANGANTARVLMTPGSFGLEWKDTGLGNYTARMDRARLLDRVLEMAEARNITIVLVIFNYSDFNTRVYPLWHENPYNAALGGPCQSTQDCVANQNVRQLFKRRLRYIAARWAYSPSILAWEWWNEVDFTPFVETELLKPWIEDMTAALREHDPYRHLTTISYSIDGDPRIWNMPEIDLAQRHEYNRGDPKWFMPIGDGRGSVMRYKQVKELLPKPTLLGEFGYVFTEERPAGAAREGIHLHNSLWAAAFNGFASTAMYWWWDLYIEPGNLWSQFKGISQFLKGEDLSALNPISVSVSAPPRMRAVVLGLGSGDSNGERALVWLRNRAYNAMDAHFQYTIQTSTGAATDQTFRFEPAELNGVTITVDGFRNDEYRVAWFDTTSGEPIGERTATATNSTLTVTAPPFRRDIAAKIIAKS